MICIFFIIICFLPSVNRCPGFSYKAALRTAWACQSLLCTVRSVFYSGSVHFIFDSKLKTPRYETRGEETREKGYFK